MQGYEINGFCFEKEIGRGSFAKTFTAIHQKTRTKVCIKVLNKLETTESAFINEAKILGKLSHPCITTLYTYFQDHNNYYLVMEYAKGSTLNNFFNDFKGEIKLYVIKHIAAQIVSVMHYLHNVAKVVHRDTKLENVIIDKDCNIKVIDFGLSKIISNEDTLMATLCGTEIYIAPEMIDMNQYTNKTDI